MRQLPARPVFTRADARALGWSDSALTRAVAAGRLVAVRRGCLAAPGPDEPRAAAIAAARARIGSVVSHRSALLMHGLPVVGRPPALPEITVRPDGTGTAHAAHLHRATLPCADLVDIDGVPVTAVARTLVDVGRSCPVAVAVAAIDAALHSDLVEPDQLDEVVLRCANWPGIRRALRALRHADGRAESPLESVSRLVLDRLGVPAPGLQASFSTASAARPRAWTSTGTSSGWPARRTGAPSTTRGRSSPARSNARSGSRTTAWSSCGGDGTRPWTTPWRCARGCSPASSVAAPGTDQVFPGSGRLPTAEPGSGGEKLIVRAGRPRACPSPSAR